ncbi:MAG: archaemetzincin family Zn-dependent metalloprotease [Candidatus Bathyarchaeia archaeon]
MKFGILRVGQVNPYILNKIRENLNKIFPKVESLLITETLPIPDESFNKTRRQYCSDIILSCVRNYAAVTKNFSRILGVVDVDIYVPNLNFVFGQADCPGKAALISLWRLKPEFYGMPPNMELFLERSTKESVHELGHTLGLMHCSNPLCVMFFSNSIFETDRKQSLFCKECQLKVKAAAKS